MIFLTLVGLLAYYILPILFTIWLCDKFDFDIDVVYLILVVLFLECAFLLQVIYWIYPNIRLF
jgi:hypothetical protein